MERFTLGIMGNSTKPTLRDVLPRVVIGLNARRARFVVDQTLAEGLELAPEQIASAQKIPEIASVILSFGGDGTLLRTARAIGHRPVPILGVNLGPGLGYLTDVGVNDLPRVLDRLLAGRFVIEERMRLTASVQPDPAEACSALNDIIIGHGTTFRTMRIEVMIDGKAVTTYRCDGLIVATPTGSTAYTLSAGGPIVEPTLQVMIVTPICPHTLTMRPVVISAHRTVEIRPHEPAMLSADGDVVRPLDGGEVIRVSRAATSTLMAIATDRDFYHVLRAKLQWGAANTEPPAGA